MRSICSIVFVLLLACEGDLSRTGSDGDVVDRGTTSDQATHAEGPPPGKEAGPPLDQGQQDLPPKPTFDGKPGEFVNSAAGRTYRLLVPSGYTHTVAIPLVVGFHGAGDSGANFYNICKYSGWATAAAPANFILLVPETKSPYKDFAIWTGNPMNDIPQMKQEMAEIVAIIKATAKHYHLATKQLHAFGFSDGGLFTAIAGMAQADYFASLGVMGYGWGASYPGGAPVRKIAAQFVVGSSGQFASHAKISEAFLKGQGHPTRIQVASGVGHSFLGLMQKFPPAGIFSWMKQHPR